MGGGHFLATPIWLFSQKIHRLIRMQMYGIALIGINRNVVPNHREKTFRSIGHSAFLCGRRRPELVAIIFQTFSVALGGMVSTTV